MASEARIAPERRRVPTYWLLALATAFLIATAILIPLDRGTEWDEAVYISQFAPWAERIPLSAHRALGITWLAAPAAMVSDSLVLMRLWMSALAAGALFGGFLTWARSIRAGAVAGFAVFATSWLSFLYLGEVSPNIYSAAISLATIGVLAGYNPTRGGGVWWGLVALLALAVIVRPSDAAFLSAAVLIGSFYLRSEQPRKIIAAVIVGGGLGSVPWVIESFANFGGPLERLDAARALVGSGWSNNVIEYFFLGDGPLVGPDNDGIKTSIVIWLIALIMLTFVGIAKSERRDPARLAFWAALILSLPYLFYTEAMAPRFLLPAVALLSVQAGVGLVSLSRRLMAGKVVVGVASVTLMLLFLQAPHAITFGRTLREDRNISNLIAQEVQSRFGDSGCLIASQYGYPQISLATGCEGTRLTPSHLASSTSLIERADELLRYAGGRDAALVIWSQNDFEALEFWRQVEVQTESGQSIFLYLSP